MQPPPLPSQGRLAGIDHGLRRIGIAVCDRERILSSPYESYESRGEAQDAEWFRQLVRDEEIVGFVIGLPVHSSGDESQQSSRVRSFAAWLFQVTGLPYCFFDERYSSQHADALMHGSELSRAKRKIRRDKLAAQIILEAYLSSPASAHNPLGPLDDPGA